MDIEPGRASMSRQLDEILPARRNVTGELEVDMIVHTSHYPVAGRWIVGLCSSSAWSFIAQRASSFDQSRGNDFVKKPLDLLFLGLRNGWIILYLILMS